jgi:hypothetical protein
MGLAPYALSVHHFISSVGADAGFASIIGLAVLVLLYFAQARETTALRQQAELAQQRVAQLESRLAHAVAVQSAQPAVTTLPPSVQPPPPGIPFPASRTGTGLAVVTPAPPAGVAAPALSAATKLIPTPPVPGLAAVAAASMAGATASAPVGATAQAPAGATAQAPVGATAPPGAPYAAPAVSAPGGFPPTATPGGAPNAAPAGGGPTNPTAGAPPTAPSPVSRIVTPRPATAAGGATASNGTGDHPVIPPPLPVPSRPPVQIRPGAGSDRLLAELAGDSGSSPNDLTRVLTALAAVAVVAAIVIVLLSVTSGGTNNHTLSHSNPPVSNAPTSQHHAAKPKVSAAVVPSSVTVGVLNGTAVYHLADSIGAQLGADGYKEGTVANAATQTQPSTTVEYVPGDEKDAAAVAKALKLSASAVQPIDSTTQQLGCPSGPCNVVVTVGPDLESTSASTQTQTTP